MPRQNVFLALGLLALSVMGPRAVADVGDSDLCLAAAAEVSAQSGVPYDVLLAISVVETGRDGLPWPWAVGIEGEGHWPDTAEEAEMLVQRALNDGTSNVDLGCFQLNLKWHAAAFVSIEDMIEPLHNAAYAAGLLSEKYAETGDWPLAAAAYHSTTPEFAEIYQVRFESTWAELLARPTETDVQPSALINRFPLLVAGLAGSPGSLVPDTGVGLRLIEGP